MRRALFTLLLALASGSAAAEWVDWFVPKNNLTQWVVANSNEAITIYANVASIRRADKLAQMWDLTDMQTGTVLGGDQRSMSLKKEQEYDCSELKARILYISWHSGNMGEGEIIGSNRDPAAWRPVLLGTILERLWKTACGK